MASLVRLAALAAAAFVAVSFLLFAEVALRDGSNGQLERLDGAPASKKLETDVQRPNPVAAVERVRENNHSSLRERIEDVNDVLASPFTGYTDFESAWGERFLVLILGLLLYGGGGLLLANFFPKHQKTTGDWREATS